MSVKVVMTNAKWSMKVAIAAVLLAGLMSGCGAMIGLAVQTRRATVDVPIPQAQSASVKGFIKLTEVKDVRRFEAFPRNPSVPSVQWVKDIKDRSDTSRAFSRRYDSLLGAMGDVLLPEGRTVEQVVREAVTKAVSERGYSVVDEKSPEFGNALPLQIDIEQFWAWQTGTFPPSLEFEGILLLKGEALIGSKEERVRGYAKGELYYDHVWPKVIQMGIADLIDKIKANVKRPD
jgi:hypothetical protein